MMLAMHGVVVECIFAEDCCEMMGCIVMATWWLACGVRGCLLVFGLILGVFTYILLRGSVPLLQLGVELV